jgi:Leucine-rich repeat (LRR) protein
MEGTDAMTIVLTYTRWDDTQGRAKFEEDVDSIALSEEGITSIDLGPLAACTDLQELTLEHNLLSKIDLTPLASCTSLQALLLPYNSLSRIDLTPLAACTDLRLLYLSDNGLSTIKFAACASLQKLYLQHNELHTIDLTPLAACTSLQELHLQGSQIQTIDLAGCASLQTLDLSGNELRTVSLAPLASCTSLQTLDLSGNELRTVNLAPLASCTNLQTLDLRGNPLQIVDLTPLASCTSLQTLDLSSTRLRHINLTPLAACTSLQEFHLASDQIQAIDMTPLANCTRLQKLWLGGSQLQSIDLTPLALCPDLRDVRNVGKGQLRGKDVIRSWLYQYYAVYMRPAGPYSWSFLYRIAERLKEDRRIQQDILAAMELQDYGFIDCDLSGLFLSIPSDTPIDEAREQVKQRLLEEIILAVDKEGATTGLRVEDLSIQHSDVAKRAQRIVELREAEMQRVVVGVSDTEVALRELWLTCHGYDVLTALEMRLTTDLNGFERIRSAFSEMGFKLNTGKTAESGAKMSNELKETIWWIAQNRGRQWNEIEG